MKLCLFLVFSFCLLLTTPSSFSQLARPSISKEPVWITKNNIDYNKTLLDKDAADGYIDIATERQISLADKSQYFRRIKKIISQAGVQNGSQISVSFDPSYEQLIFHTIFIMRNGEKLNRLDLSNIQTIHQEKELANFIYNGSLNAILILADVREGDIIEYSYSIKGFNPIFKNKYADVYSMRFSVPVYEIYYKLIVPTGRKINIKNLNEVIQPVVTSLNGRQIYEWRKSDITPLILQDYTPSSYDTYSQIFVSEYDTWKDVNDWAMELFPVKIALSAAVQSKIREIEVAQSGDEKRTMAALRFVQDDIRYMGIEMGENSHKPADPSKVFAQRFGDCKEKSYLLCCMLNAMYINASPVLINTVAKKNITLMLPAPTNFDHVTVRVKLGNSYYWFDPTIAYQRGSVKELFYPDYQAGLVISDSTVSLTPITFRNNGYEHIKELFQVPAMFGPGTLTVVTAFKGNEADNARDNFNNQSIREIMTSYQKFYSRYYEDIKADSLTYTDDDSTGIFTTKEYYTIPKFWDITKNNVNKFTFSSFAIGNILRRPKERDRKMPFELAFPIKYTEEIIVFLPDDWKVTESETHLKNTSFAYNNKFFCKNSQVYLEADYENYKDNVAPGEVAAYFKDLNEYDDAASFDITLDVDKPLESSSKTTNRNLLSTILFVGVIAGGLIWWGKRK